jgi:hypothetical protein
MASITYWSQLLPSPRAASVAQSLAARLRDPAWLLARQWQLGEFEGVDTGSPAFVQIGSHTAALASAQIGSTSQPLAAQALLEPLLEAEPFTPDLATRVEVGQCFEALLAQGGVAASVRDQFRTVYPLVLVPDRGGADPSTTAFLRICAGRAIDGVALFNAVRSASGGVPAAPALEASVQPAVRAALAAFVEWVTGTWSAFGLDDPRAWDPTRLEYTMGTTAGAAARGTAQLTVEPDTLAELDWFAFDIHASVRGAPAISTTSVVPGHVRFRGMPDSRWWVFEGSKTDFGAIVPDTRDLARLLFMDFMLLHGDDWFLAPLSVPAGSLCFIDSLTVTDVFGLAQMVPRADASGGWTMFSPTDASGAPVPCLVVPAVASASLLTGPAIEDVHLLRDETADMAWAIECVVEGPLGGAESEPLPPAPDPTAGAPAGLVYQLSTPLPASWYPLMPVQANGAVNLLAGAVEGQAPPRGRIVSRLGAAGFQMPDGEVPRSGVRVRRIVCRARSADGKSHLWIARRRQIGAGAASSGLRFDVASTGH